MATGKTLHRKTKRSKHVISNVPKIVSVSALRRKITLLNERVLELTRENRGLKIRVDREARQERIQARKEAHARDLRKISARSTTFDAETYRKYQDAMERSQEEHARIGRLVGTVKRLSGEIAALKSENASLESENVRIGTELSRLKVTRQVAKLQPLQVTARVTRSLQPTLGVST